MILYKSIQAVFMCDYCNERISLNANHLSSFKLKKQLKSKGWKIEKDKHYCNDDTCIFKRKWKL